MRIYKVNKNTQRGIKYTYFWFDQLAWVIAVLILTTNSVFLCKNCFFFSAWYKVTFGREEDGSNIWVFPNICKVKCTEVHLQKSVLECRQYWKVLSYLVYQRRGHRLLAVDYPGLLPIVCIMYVSISYHIIIQVLTFICLELNPVMCIRIQGYKIKGKSEFNQKKFGFFFRKKLCFTSLNLKK